MTEGYISDATIDDDVIVMDEPFCTITLDLDQLSPAEAVEVGGQLNALDDDTRMRAMSALDGHDSAPRFGEAQLHLDVGHALTLLVKAGLLDLGQGPQPTDEGAEEVEAE